MTVIDSSGKINPCKMTYMYLKKKTMPGRKVLRQLWSSPRGLHPLRRYRGRLAGLECGGKGLICDIRGAKAAFRYAPPSFSVTGGPGPYIKQPASERSTRAHSRHLKQATPSLARLLTTSEVESHVVPLTHDGPASAS